MLDQTKRGSNARAKRENWWLRGYNAAMKAKQPNEINDAIACAGEATDHQREMFRIGWRSVWDCERAGTLNKEG